MRQSPIIRFFDIIFSVVLLLIGFLPLLLAMTVKLIADGRPLFYNSRRIGKDGIPFTVYKFRTMVNDRKAIETYLSGIHSYGFEKIPASAPIYTKIGRIFEKFQIVEVLQLINVLEGNMSIIGYRPLPELRVKQLTNEMGEAIIQKRHAVLPGITGLSQIVGKTELSNKERIEIELFYNKFITENPPFRVLKFNLMMIVETLSKILLKKYIFNLFRKNQIFQTIDAENETEHLVQAVNRNVSTKHRISTQ
jgi:lipopolysaccharide/colanic/teichoic acid biosynthesis glycosyltransferase